MAQTKTNTVGDNDARNIGHLLHPDIALPAWLTPVLTQIDGAALPNWVLHASSPIPAAARPSAVLMLLSDGNDGPDIVLIKRAATLRSHAGQPAFPGGAREPGEGPVAAALREAQEETGIAEGSVIPTAILPEIYLTPSAYAVRPVLGYWPSPGPVRAVDPAETAQVARVPLAQLADPRNRGSVPLAAGLTCPAFTVANMVVWGFTAGLVDLLLEWGGWALPWDRGRMLTADGR